MGLTVTAMTNETPTHEEHAERQAEGQAEGQSNAPALSTGGGVGPRWQPADRAALTLRSGYEPLAYTPHMARLVQVGRALGDDTRMLVLALLAEEDRPMYGQEIAARLSLSAQNVSHHLGILRNAGLVRERRENTYRYYVLDTDSIRQLGEMFADGRLALPTKADERAQVLAVFFEDGRLRSIPSQAAKLRCVLEQLARAFEWGRLYEEREVNETLQRYHEDTARLRRELVDAGLLMRERGRYWLVRPHDAAS